MLYVFHGTDTYKVADQANKLVAGLRVKRPDAQVYVFEGELMDVAPLDELVNAQGLFVQKHVVVLKGVCEKAESRELVFARLEQFSTSENIFVLSEGALHVAHKRTLEKHAQKSEEHTRSVIEKRGFDPFGIVVALKARNKRALWEGYVHAQRAGENAEAQCGRMHWAVKDMLQNTRQYSSKYTKEDLVEMSRALITLYHDAHRGLYSLDIALERWALSV
ncbi:MAG: hypothetical protein KBD24_02550 [Candidatus Pacebacteria bacterium]|nr:hypothetical protein [Candidatus Paceibacterota bacterium]